MTMAAENKIATVLQEVTPRPGFSAGLMTILIQDRNRLPSLDSAVGRSRTRWIVAGAVAGVVSATGAVYWGARRRHKGVA